jgi:hypothetical protein
VAALGALGLAVPPAWADYSPPTSGLVGWWRANGDATDSSGNGHNGALQGGMGFTTGVYGQAFNSSAGKRVFVPDSPAFQLTSMTIAGFAYPTLRGYSFFFRGDNRSDLDPYTFGMDNSNSNCVFVLTDATGAHSQLETSTPMRFNEWHHYAATLDGTTHDMRIYVDGVLTAQTTATVTPYLVLDSSQVPGVGIGNVQNFYDFPWNGGIDETVLYNRALSPAEVASLAVVPEPSSVMLAILGASGALLLRACRRGRRRDSAR